MQQRVGLDLAGRGVGFGLIAQMGDQVGSKKAGKTFLTLEGKEAPLPPAAVPSGEVLGVQFACLSMEGRLLTYPLD